MRVELTTLQRLVVEYADAELQKARQQHQAVLQEVVRDADVEPKEGLRFVVEGGNMILTDEPSVPPVKNG